MRDWVVAVTEFHAKYGFVVGGKLGESQSTVATRAHLVLEEVGELVEAMEARDEVATLDAIVDLIYVAVGTAVAFGLPLAEAFDEIHRSNMTKTIQRDRPDHPGKGKGYSAPNLIQLLNEM